MPTLHLIAGPNGAGKTTFYRYLLAPRHPSMPFIDAQDWGASQQAEIPDAATRAVAARMWADEARQLLLQKRQSFVTESAFSHPSRVALITQARTLGYEVVLYAMALDDPRVLLARVNQRVREGGHALPSHKVLDRYPKSLANLRQAVPVVDLALLIDAADAAENGPQLVASVLGGRMELQTFARPRWVDRVLGLRGS